MALDFSAIINLFKKIHLSCSTVLLYQHLLTDCKYPCSVCHSQCARPWQTVVAVALQDLGPGQIALPSLRERGSLPPSPPSGDPRVLPALLVLARQVSHCSIFSHADTQVPGGGLPRWYRGRKSSDALWGAVAGARLSPGALTTPATLLCLQLLQHQTKFQFSCMQLTQLFLTPEFYKAFGCYTFYCPPNTGEISPINVFLLMASKEIWHVPWNYHTKHRIYKFG